MRAFLGKRMMPFLVLLSLVLCGCADLGSISTFSQISSESAAYTTLTEDYVKTVERDKRYEDKKQQKALNEIIERRKAQQVGLLAMHKLVSDYMSTLGELASDEVISYDQSLDGMAKAIGNIKDKDGKQVVAKENIDSVDALCKLLTKAFTDSYRQNRLKEIISSSNKDFQIVIAGLKEYIEVGYIGSLETERTAAKEYYEGVISVAESHPPQQAAIVLLQDKLNGINDAIDAKKQAAELYMEILDKIAKGHQFLYDKRDKITSRQLLSTISGYGNDIANLYVSISNLE